MTDRELMQQALEALENQKRFWVWAAYRYEPLQTQDAITALRDRLAQSEQGTGNLLKDAYNAMVEKKTRSQRPWVGLTDEEIIDLIHPLVMADMAEKATDYEIARAIEAKLKEKNCG